MRPRIRKRRGTGRQATLVRARQGSEICGQGPYSARGQPDGLDANRQVKAFTAKFGVAPVAMHPQS